MKKIIITLIIVTILLLSANVTIGLQTKDRIKKIKNPNSPVSL